MTENCLNFSWDTGGRIKPKLRLDGIRTKDQIYYNLTISLKDSSTKVLLDCCLLSSEVPKYADEKKFISKFFISENKSQDTIDCESDRKRGQICIQIFFGYSLNVCALLFALHLPFSGMCSQMMFWNFVRTKRKQNHISFLVFAPILSWGM